MQELFYKLYFWITFLMTDGNGKDLISTAIISTK